MLLGVAGWTRWAGAVSPSSSLGGPQPNLTKPPTISNALETLAQIVWLGLALKVTGAVPGQVCEAGMRTWRKECLMLLPLLTSPWEGPAALYELTLPSPYWRGVSEHQALCVPSTLEVPQLSGCFPWCYARVCCGCAMAEGSQHWLAMKLVTRESTLPTAGVLRGHNTGKPSIYGRRQGCSCTQLINVG